MSTKLKPNSPRIDRMTSAYRLLYQIETHLKNLIEQTFIRAYGPHWHQYYKNSIDLKSPRYSDLINLLQAYPILQSHFSNSTLERLSRLKQVRNKIAHMVDINMDEYGLLESCYESVMKVRVKK